MQEADLWRNAACEVVVDEHNLVECLSHVADGRRNAAAKPVVCENHHGGRGITQVRWDRLAQPVRVEEDGIQRSVEQFTRDGSLKIIEPEVEITQGRQCKHNPWEGTDKPVVAEIELMEEAEMDECVRHGAAKAVGVEMQQS